MIIKKYVLNKVAISCWVLSGLFLIIYKAISSHVDNEGILVEPFFLIPFGYLFLFIGITSVLIQCVNNKFFNKHL